MNDQDDKAIAELRKLLSDIMNMLANNPIFKDNFFMSPQNIAEHICDLFYAAILDSDMHLNISDIYIGVYSFIKGDSFIYCSYKRQQIFGMMFHSVKSS